MICRFCHFNFADAPFGVLCDEHEAPVCPSCYCCQAVEPPFSVFLAALWRDAS